MGDKHIDQALEAIDAVLAAEPTQTEYEDRLRAIEDSEVEELMDCVRHGYYSQADVDHMIYDAFKLRHGLSDSPTTTS